MEIPSLREQFLAALEAEARHVGLPPMTYEQRRWADFALRWMADRLRSFDGPILPVALAAILENVAGSVPGRQRGEGGFHQLAETSAPALLRDGSSPRRR